MHVTLRAGLGCLRRQVVARVVLSALRDSNRCWFRVVHYSVQSNHVHLIVEAEDKAALSRGMQGLLISAGKRLNKQIRHKGCVFPDRYYAEIIGSPRQARHALAYVLNNWRRHRQDAQAVAKLDPYASGIAFNGWAQRVRFRVPDGYAPLPVSAPRTQLLVFDWQQFERIDLYEQPTAT